MKTVIKDVFYPPVADGDSVAEITGLCGYLAVKAPACGCFRKFIYKKGETIYDPGKPFPGICEVVAGAVRISHLTESGEEVTSEVLTRADLFGNLKAQPDNPSELARALIDSEIWVYEPDEFLRFAQSHPILGGWYTTYLMQRWLLLEKRLLRINACKATENVAHLRQSFNRKVRDAHGREQVLLKLVTQKDLADLIGTTRQTVALAMKTIERADPE